MSTSQCRALLPHASAFREQVALPELDGALEPIVFAGRDSNTGKSHSLPDRIDTLCNRAINWAKCAARWAASLVLAQTVGQNWRG